MSCYGWGFKALLFVRVHVYALLYSTISPKVPFLSMKAPVSVTAAGLLGSWSELVGFGMDLIGLTYVFELLGSFGSRGGVTGIYSRLLFRKHNFFQRLNDRNFIVFLIRGG